MPKVTVLTATYNGERHLEETVNSILAQTYKDFEYIIVDDGSTDSTPNMLDRLAASDARIQIVRRDVPGGPYVAANTGLRVASGKYVANTDHDDISLPGRLEAQIRFLEEDIGLEACTTCTRSLRDGVVTMRGWNPPPWRVNVLKWQLCLGHPLCHSSLFVQREAMNEIGGYKEETQTNEDYRLFCRLARRGRFAVLPEFHVLYRVHGGSVTQSRGEETTSNDISVAAEHLEALTGKHWPANLVFALHNKGGRKARAGEILHALQMWDDAWINDLSLSPGEFCELRRISGERRRAMLRARARRQPLLLLRYLKTYLQPFP